MLLAMNRHLLPASHAPLPVPRVPMWATPRARVADPIEAAFMAGSALNALDNLVQAEPEWGGAWRNRLALKAAAASMNLIGRSEDEAALRDAWLLRQPGDDPGPAGNVLAAWRRLVGRSSVPDAETIAAVVPMSVVIDRVTTDYTDVRARLMALPEAIAGRVEQRLADRVREVADEQVRNALKALRADKGLHPSEEE